MLNNYRIFIGALCLCLAAFEVNANQICNSKAALNSSRFEVLQAGLLFDKETNLTWYRCSNNNVWDGSECQNNAATATWQDSLQAVHNLSYAGYSDWRLPSIKELNSIIEHSCYYPALNLSLFPHRIVSNNTSETLLWSSTSAVSARLTSESNTGMYVTNIIEGSTRVIPKVTRASYFMLRSATSVKRGIKLNDTGITWCADGNNNNLDCPVTGYEGQDAEYGRDAQAKAGTLEKVGGGNGGFDFTKLDVNGNDLPESASAWSCVRDNHTGLIWEVKTDDGDLHDKNDRYNWYNPDSNTHGGHPGFQDDDGDICYGYDANDEASYCNTHAYVERVNTKSLCGANDWRMPTRLELMGIVDNNTYNPAIDTRYFPQTQSSWFWSSSPYVINGGVWYVGFGHGYVGYGGTKDFNNYVRLTRSAR